MIQKTRSPASDLPVFFLLLVVLGITFTSYRPGLSGPFLLDDISFIPQTELHRLDWRSIQEKLFSSTRLGSLSRSVTKISFALTNHFNVAGPYPIKYQNLMLHLINGLLIFWLLWLLLVESVPGSQRRQQTYAVLAVAAIWLLHPLQVSTVLYAVQRLVILSALFSLLALITYVKGRRLMDHRPLLGFAVASIGTGLFGLLALLSKETGALLPLMIGAIELFFLSQGESSRRNGMLIRLLRSLFVYVPLAVGSLYAATHVPELLSGYAGRDFALADRLMTQVHAIALYLQLFFVPLPSTMSLYHDGFPVTRTLDASTILLAASYFGSIVAAVLLRRRAPVIAFGIIWFSLCQALESTFIPLEMVFEHRSYLAILGLATVTVALAIGAAKNLGLVRRFLPLAAASLVALLAFNTAARAFVWSDHELMLVTEYEQNPSSSRVLSALLTLELARGNQPKAWVYYKELSSLDLPHAAPELIELLVRCSDQAANRYHFERTETKLRQGVLAPFATNALRDLSDRFREGNCKAITAEQLLALTQAAADNERAHNMTTPCVASEINVQLLLYAERWDEAEPAAKRYLDRCNRASPALFSIALRNLITFATKAGSPDKFIPFLNDVSEGRYASIIRLYGESKAVSDAAERASN